MSDNQILTSVGAEPAMGIDTTTPVVSDQQTLPQIDIPDQNICEYDTNEFQMFGNVVIHFDNRTVTLYTKNQVLYSITKLYIDLVLQHPTIQQIDRIESDLISSVRISYQKHNEICGKGEKWRIPDSLHFSQIAMILAHCFNVKRICCCPQNTDAEYDLLGIYVDETFAHHVRRRFKCSVRQIQLFTHHP